MKVFHPHILTRAMALMVFSFMFIITGCGLLDGESGGFKVTTLDPVAGDVSFTLTGADGADYIVAVSSLSGSSGGNIYSIAADAGNGGGEPAAISPRPISTRRFNPKALAFDAKLRQQEQQLVANGVFDNAAKFHQIFPANRAKDGEQCTSDEACDGIAFCDNGICRTQVTLNYTDPDTGDTEPVVALVKRVGTRAILVVDENDDPDPNDLETLGKRFDTVIYPRDMFFFGKNLEEKNLDRDGNGKTIIFLTGLLNQTDLVGYFLASDYASTTQVPNSNERDMFYTVVPDEETPVSLIAATIAHEFQHMINFSTRVYQQALNDDPMITEEVWLNEGLSHLAEDLAGYGDDTQEAVRVYLQNTVLTSLAFPDAQGGVDTIAARGFAYSFLRYLFEQKGSVIYGTKGDSLVDGGGASFLNKLYEGDATSISNVMAALGGSDFNEMFMDFTVALVVDGTGWSTNSKYNFNEIDLDAITKQYHGINLRGTRITEASGNVNLDGPKLTPFVGDGRDMVVQSYGMQYFSAKPTDDMDLMLQSDPLGKIKLVVIRTK